MTMTQASDSIAASPPRSTRWPRFHRWIRTSRFRSLLIFSSLSFFGLTVPAIGAEGVSVSYGPLELSLSVEELQTYAESGQMSNSLSFYARFVDDEDLAQLRDMLRDRVDLNAVAMSQILYSSFGETSLRHLGELIQTDAHQNGFYALRSALISAADTPDGLTLINLLKHFPTPTVRIQSGRAMQVAGEFTQLLQHTERVTTMMGEQAATDAAAGPVNFAHRLDLQVTGAFSWQQKTLRLHDRQRQRHIVADLYTPDFPEFSDPAPVLVISHGIAADRDDFSELAQHLVSHGFAVAVLDHPGSDRQHFQNLLRGLTQEMTEPNEFVNRPLDISYLLDQLEQLNQTDEALQYRLNLHKIGVIGHSLGGYTALALAGAQLNLDLLRQECQPSLIDLNTANLSMPLQCEALQTTASNQQLYDPRIGAIVAVNSVSNSVFGEEGLQPVQVPVMFIGGSSDIISPVLLEQVCPFTWLTAPEKYLAVIEKGTHIYSHEAAEQSQPLPGESDDPHRGLAHRYLQALSLAFAKVHVAAQPEYRDYLRASYAQSISQSPRPLMLLNAVNTLPLSLSLQGTCPGRFLSQGAQE